MKLTISIEYAHDEDLPDITVEQVKKALQKFIVPSRSLHIYRAVEHSVHPTLLTLCQYCNREHDSRVACPEYSERHGRTARKDRNMAYCEICESENCEHQDRTCPGCNDDPRVNCPYDTADQRHLKNIMNGKPDELWVVSTRKREAAQHSVEPTIVTHERSSK